MKFLHTGDWHIGKKLNGFDLLVEQQHAFEEMLAIAKEEQVDGIIIAGDLYDRSVPSTEAVELFNQMLVTMNLNEEFPIFAISGNHDSATRLETGGPWYEARHFHLHTRLVQGLTPVEFGNVQLYLLPYFEPFEARDYFQNDEIRSIDVAMSFVVAEMKKSFKPEMKQVLVSHFFVAGSETSDSETKVMVGGLDVVPLSLLTDFDYVALGHLHNKNAIKGDNARYSGSLLKYSLSEIKQQKGVWLVELGDKETAFEFRQIPILHDLIVLEESFERLMSPAYYETVKRDDYIAIALTDRGVIPNVMAQLRTIYPKIIQLERVYGRERQEKLGRDTTRKLETTSPKELFEAYFKATTGEPLTANQQKWLTEEMMALQKES